MRNKLGPPVEGEDFFGREKELKYAWKSIKDGNNLILPSPRRVGKTSFALKLLTLAEEENWDIINVNLEEHTEESFIKELIRQLSQKTWSKKLKKEAGDILKNIKINPEFSVSEVSMKLNLEWRQKEVYDKLSGLMSHDKPTLVFLDEVTVLLDKMTKEEFGVEKVKLFLHWLRSTRIKSNSKIKWIYCSSVGIENFTHHHNMGETVNDLKQFKLKPFSKKVGKEMLKELSKNSDFKLKKEIRQEIVDKLEYCIPYFLQLIFDKINHLVSVDDIELNQSIVEKAYLELLDEAHFNTWIERIQRQYFELVTMAFIVLKELARVSKGMKREKLVDVLVANNVPVEEVDSLLAKLLYMLSNDGYLSELDGLHSFRSPLLRDFWFKRYNA